MVAATNTGVPFQGGRVNSPGQESQADNTLFGALSQNTTSARKNVSEVPYLIQVYNLVGDDELEVLMETITAAGSVMVPMFINGRAVTLSNTRNVLLLDLPGFYRFRIPGSSLGTCIAVAQETNFAYDSFGLASFALNGTVYTFVETATVKPTVVGNAVSEAVKLSAVAGNLLQIQPDGMYYGLTPATYANQYVSSSTGNDLNAGTSPSTPLRTIQKAIQNLPDGTMGTIHLFAGDTFHTYPTATTDTVTTLTFNQAIFSPFHMSTGSRQISFVPYNDTAVDAIIAYNEAHGTTFSPYVTQEENFPTINFTVCIPTDSTTLVPINFGVGNNGLISFFGINLTVGNTAAAVIGYQFGAITGSGEVYVKGGHLRLGSVPFIGDQSVGFSQTVSLDTVNVSNHTTGASSPSFALTNQQYFIVTIADFAAGDIVCPTLPYTNIGSNVEAFLATAALWPGLVIYSTPNRAFRHVITAIPIA